MLWYMKHCNYEKLKPKLIRAGMGHIRGESQEEIAYAQDMFETIFRDYKQEKDVHISGLLADLMNQTPVTAADFAALKGRILLILPNQDFFSGKTAESTILTELLSTILAIFWGSTEHMLFAINSASSGLVLVTTTSKTSVESTGAAEIIDLSSL